MLQSHVQDTWVTPTATEESAVDVRDAVTGDLVCHVSSEDLDVEGAFAHARRVGGPALRDLTFHQRAALLDALAAAVRARREELYALSARAGATLTDARYDVDGGIRVLRDYADRARAELPDAPYLVEGPAERLARGEDFLGVHLCTPSPGLMLQVNAFSFPVWAPLEKLAQAVPAGVPGVVKPATPTAYLTAQLVRIVTDAGVLPPGTPQMVVGSVRPALGLLRKQDVLSFTGSPPPPGRCARTRTSWPAPSGSTPRPTPSMPSSWPRTYGPARPSHLGRRSETSWDEETGAGRLVFPNGTGSLTATEGALLLAVESDAGHLALLEDVVGRHLVRFGTKDELVVEWHRDTGEPGTTRRNDSARQHLDRHRSDG
ncbi:aldehyde dehydrogenase family protein [Streptomyces sp. NPDC002838]|uniref:aldehyde dehydrogenase family protein n=1 Tax=Streptomyces sp. NPDC002838 TaxID=3154436 RepID=UPI0033195006